MNYYQYECRYYKPIDSMNINVDFDITAGLITKNCYTVTVSGQCSHIVIVECVDHYY